MRVAPLKGTCKICQAPEYLRLAVNGAIWSQDGIRHATYVANAMAILSSSGVPELEVIDRKTVRRHADHVEDSWRDVRGETVLADDEVPVASDFASVTTLGARLGAKALLRLERNLDVLDAKDTIAVAKVGLQAANVREQARLKRNQQQIDVMAIFALSGGHMKGSMDDERDDATLGELRSELDSERRLLVDRAS